MSRWCDEAVSKMRKDLDGIDDRREKAMAPAVFEALESFCAQDDEFAQAVVQGGSLKECMKAVAKGVGSCISDLEAYQRAVSFFFPGAGIKFSMKIDLCASVKDAPHIDGPGIVLDLSDFM